MGMAAWALGGIVSLIGALCYAELASAYRTAGGDYTYLTRAYGSKVGFMFAWAELSVIRTGGSIAFMAYVFARYATEFYPLGPNSKLDLRPARDHQPDVHQRHRRPAWPDRAERA